VIGPGDTLPPTCTPCPKRKEAKLLMEKKNSAGDRSNDASAPDPVKLAKDPNERTTRRTTTINVGSSVLVSSV